MQTSYKDLLLFYLCFVALANNLTVPVRAQTSPIQTEQQDLLKPEIKDSQTTIPVPPNITLPQLTNATVVKEPLAWRAKALAMSAEYPFSERNSIAWVLPVAYDKGQILLKRAIAENGMKLIGEYPDAGQYLISNESKPEVVVGARAAAVRYINIRSGLAAETKTYMSAPARIETIIVSQPAGGAKTLYKLRIYGASAYTTRADSQKMFVLPTTMKNLLENPGLWQ